MSSRGAAQFRIGSCTYRNMVLRFSICPAFARLFLRRRCNFSWVLTHRLQPRVFFHPNAVYDPAAYASRGAAPFRIGSCAYRNVVLHFSRLSSVAVLHRICPRAGLRRSASDHAHIATWFCGSACMPVHRIMHQSSPPFALPGGVAHNAMETHCATAPFSIAL